MRRFAVITGTVLLGVLGAVQLSVLALDQAPPQTQMRTDKGLYLHTVVEPGYDVTVTEIERGVNYSVLDMKGFVPTVTAGGVVLFRAVYDIARERGFSHAFLVPPRQPQRPPVGRTDKGRDVSGVTKVFMIKDPQTDPKDLLGGDYSVEAQQLYDKLGYTSIAQLAALFGGSGRTREPDNVAIALPNRGQAGSLQLVGEWKAVRGEFGGTPLPASQLPKIAMKFEKDGRWTAEGGEAIWTADESTVPKTLDITHTAGRSKGKTQLCIYEVTDDSLTILFGTLGEGIRPTMLTATSETPSAVLFVFARVK